MIVYDQGHSELSELSAGVIVEFDSTFVISIIDEHGRHCER